MTKLEQTLVDAVRGIKGWESLSPKDALSLLIEELGIVTKEMNPIGWGVNDDDQEFHGYLEELENILSFVPDDFIITDEVKEILGVFISYIPWDNFENDYDKEEEEYEGGEQFMTLGSMFYNKLTWVSEMCTNEKAQQFGADYANDLIPFLNELEVLCK